PRLVGFGRRGPEGATPGLDRRGTQLDGSRAQLSRDPEEQARRTRQRLCRPNGTGPALGETDHAAPSWLYGGHDTRAPHLPNGRRNKRLWTWWFDVASDRESRRGAARDRHPRVGGRSHIGERGRAVPPEGRTADGREPGIAGAPG